METLKQQVRQAMTPPSKEDQLKFIMTALKIISVIALVVALMIGIGWASYLSGVSQGKRNAEVAAKVTNYQKWEIPVTVAPAEKSTPIPTPAASAIPADNFPPPVVAPGRVVVGSVTKLVTLSKAPSVTMTFGATGVHVLVALSADQWRELLARSGDTNLEKVGAACLNVDKTCSSVGLPGSPSDSPSSVGLSVETVKHLAQPYISQLTAEQAEHTYWEVTVELFTP